MLQELFLFSRGCGVWLFRGFFLGCVGVMEMEGWRCGMWVLVCLFGISWCVRGGVMWRCVWLDGGYTR